MNGDLWRLTAPPGVAPMVTLNVSQLSGWSAARYARMKCSPNAREALLAHVDAVRRRTAVSFDMARDMAYSAPPWDLVQAAADADSPVTWDYLLHHAASRGAGQLASCERAHPWADVEDSLMSLTAFPLSQEDARRSACEEWLLALLPEVKCEERNWRVLLGSLALARDVRDLSLHLQALRPEPRRVVHVTSKRDNDPPDLVIAAHDGPEGSALWHPLSNPYLRARYVDGVLRVRSLFSHTLWSSTSLAGNSGPLGNTSFHDVDSPPVVISVARQMRICVPPRVVNFYESLAK